MKIIFLGDGHLSNPDTKDQQALCQFLGGLKDADKLVITGDLFEFWIGFGSYVFPHYSDVIDKLHEVKSRGTELIYVEGNHDFHMGRYFKETLGVTVYPKKFVLTINDKSILVMHGDTATKSLSYHLWRWFSRSLAFKIFIKFITPNMAQKIAQYLSTQSKTYKGERADAIDDELIDYAERKLLGRYDAVIMGHSHKQTAHTIGGDLGRPIKYINTGSWQEFLNYIEFSDGEFHKKTFEF